MITPESPHQPFKDAITVFKNGHVLIEAYKEKYGVSYRKNVIKALEEAHEHKS